MQISKAAPRDIPQIKQLWNFRFNKENNSAADMMLSSADTKDIYTVKENGAVTAAFITTELEYKGCKGVYLYTDYTAFSGYSAENRAEIIDFIIKDKSQQGFSFFVAKPVGNEDFTFWRENGFGNIVTHRVFDTEIKRNIWQAADFDIITASRFPSVREKFTEENIIHHSKTGYGLYTRYMYTRGDSTAENKGAYAVYRVEKGRLTVRELFAVSTLTATQLLQAIRERSGCETATVFLPENSTLFLGEGGKIPVYAVKGISEEVYVNLMF